MSVCVYVMYETTTSALVFKWVSKKRVFGWMSVY